MAREYGKVLTRIWGDPDFRALSGTAQHLYMQLISQPDMSMAGVLTTAPARWAGQTAGKSTSDVQDALVELDESLFTVTDEATMETLVRSFVRNDLGWRSPRTMIGIDSSVRAILSSTLKGVISAELGRCDTETLSEKRSDTTGRTTREVVEGLIAGLRRDFPDTPSPLRIQRPDTPSHTPTDTPSDGVSHGVRSSSPTATATTTATTTEPEPEPAHEPAPATAPATATRKSPTRPIDSPEFTKFWTTYPRKTNKGAARTAWENALERAAPEEIITGAHTYANDPNLPIDQTKIPHASTWLNNDRWEDGPQPAAGDHLTRGDIAMRREAQAAMHRTGWGQPTITYDQRGQLEA